jgi:hypothetical protein
MYTSIGFCYYFKFNIGGMISLSYEISNKYVVVQVYVNHMYTSNMFCYYFKFNIGGMYASLAYNIVLCASFVHLSSHILD